jgi:hypothetical protein
LLESLRYSFKAKNKNNGIEKQATNISTAGRDESIAILAASKNPIKQAIFIS